jgi:predicted dehydrogenase
MKQIRLASIGAGMIGHLHAGIARRLEDCDYVALCDPDPAKEKLAAELGVKYYRDYRRMIEKEKLDGVLISVPNEAHDGVGVQCAERGLHLFMEKPIASTLEAADRLIAGARASKVRLYVAHHRRFNPRINKAREMVRGGELGELVGVSVLWCMYKPSEYFTAGSWRAGKGGGPILINTIHEIDLLRYIHGEIARVYAEVSNKSRGFEVEDTVSVSMRFADGALASILMSDAAPSLWGYESTAGENPFFYPTKGDLYHFLGRKASLTFPGLVKVFYADAQRVGWQHPISTQQLEVPRCDPYEEQLKHFCRVVRGEEQPRTSGEDARRSLEIALALRESGATGRAIAL